MGNEAGQWIMYGVDWDDPECIHTVEEATIYINEVGFLPLLKNEIPGFSLEERTVPEYWWCDDSEKDPWMWRTIIARKHDIVYGKFFDKKAGFISRQWLPVYANYRRDGYDFDALYEDGIIPTYSIPKNVVSTYITDMSGKLRYEVDRGLDVAISENAPGRSIVVDKQTYQIGGLFSPGSDRVYGQATTPARAYMDEAKYLKPNQTCPE